MAREENLKFQICNFGIREAGSCCTDPERVLGEANPDTGEARVGISKVLAQSADDNGALDQVIPAEAIRRGHIGNDAAVLHVGRPAV